MPPPAVACYTALRSRDRRFDGVFFTGVRTTGIHCRPVCPTRAPKAENSGAVARRAEAWRPWRAYAAALLWQSLIPAKHRDISYE